MKSYSPVDNVHAAQYPNILVTAGLHDPRVGAPPYSLLVLFPSFLPSFLPIFSGEGRLPE